MEILQIENLSFRYPGADKNALSDISLSVKEGEFAVICGASGCGKSTLLRLLKKELSPYGEKSGRIIYRGTATDILDDRTAAEHIGYVLQNPEAQIVTDTVWHELAFGLESLGLDRSAIRRRVAEMAGYFGIEGWFHKKTAELSGGQKQLLNLASVMAMQPQILLLDEPTAQLDPIAASNFINTVYKLNRDLGLTVLLVEHRLEEVFPIADRVILLEGGRMIYADSPKRVPSFLKGSPSPSLEAGLPAAMKIFGMVGGEGASPITVRQGREFITKNYRNDISSPDIPEYRHSESRAVELREVFFRYEKASPDVMKGTSLTVYSGEHFCILGGNGAGKTTALGVIAGLLPAYRGKVLIKGKSISSYKGNSLYRGLVGLLPQDPQTVFLEKTVREDLAEACKIMKYSKEDAASRIAGITKKLGIAHLLDCHPYDLSGGEVQKAALAKVLLNDPAILLLDEPTKGIDAGAKQTLADIIRGLKTEGVTVLTVTHDMEFAAQTADRVGMFFDGEMASVATPYDFFGENTFYTTAACRISKGFYKNAVLCEQVAGLCLKNGKKAVEHE